MFGRPTIQSIVSGGFMTGWPLPRIIRLYCVMILLGLEHPCALPGTLRSVCCSMTLSSLGLGCSVTAQAVESGWRGHGLVLESSLQFR